MSREIDAKVAECLGWTEINPHQELIAGGYGIGVRKGEVNTNLKGSLLRTPIPYYSSSGEDMLWLIADAREDGYLFEMSESPIDSACKVSKWNETEKTFELLSVFHLEEINYLPAVVALAYLEAKGVDITPYLKEKIK
ncbi:hypothetical protein EEL31_08760 [Brevibacillus laterosporus]|nr:hypothetical protein [Brevibacillus laterosporus]TPG68600.1 hypothetical protein EEL31_08760 [Brevibacillus laterosporus]